MVTMLITGRISTTREDCETIDQHIARHEKNVKESNSLWKKK